MAETMIKALSPFSFELIKRNWVAGIVRLRRCEVKMIRKCLGGQASLVVVIVL